MKAILKTIIAGIFLILVGLKLMNPVKPPIKNSNTTTNTVKVEDIRLSKSYPDSVIANNHQSEWDLATLDVDYYWEQMDNITQQDKEGIAYVAYKYFGIAEPTKERAVFIYIMLSSRIYNQMTNKFGDKIKQ